MTGLSNPMGMDGGPTRKRPRWLFVASAIVVAAVVASAAGFVYVWNLTNLPGSSPTPGTTPPDGNLPAHEVALLGNGSVVLDLPLMTMYTAPPLAVNGFVTSVEVSFASFSNGPSSNFTFEWAAQSGAGLPVRFVLLPLIGGTLGPYLEPASGNGFKWYPEGQCAPPCISKREVDSTSSVGTAGLISIKWQMAYTTRLMAETTNFVEDRWLQIDYRLRPLIEDIGFPLPTSNVTAPSPSDLIPAWKPVHLSAPFGAAWVYILSVHSVASPEMWFHYTMGAPVILEAGSFGSLTATLSSSFAWNAAGDDVLKLSGTDGVDATLQFYLDARFGGLLVRYV